MDWKILFSTRRVGKTSTLIEKEPLGRSEFQRDLDRIIFSSAFRRLQNKTQVIPIPGSDFIHTRLTHSLEAFCVGRSLGQIVGKEICNGYDLKVTPEDIAAIVATACIAHDIGNPPLGHSGEDAISEFFKNEGADFLEGISDKQRSDLAHFDGNALGFHIITHSLPGRTTIAGGMRLTFTSLAAFTKYPNDSSESSIYKQGEKHKYGIFQSEIEVYENIATTLGIDRIAFGNDPERREWLRHPLAFLVEAADDICYRVIDFEDAYRMGVIDFRDAVALLSKIGSIDKTRFKSITDDHEKISYLRSRAINTLVEQAAACFIDNIDNIIRGTYKSSLTDDIPASNSLRSVHVKTIDNMYRKRSVIETETAGYEWISGLLKTFVSAIVKSNKSKYDEKIISLIPREFLNNKGGMPSSNKYSDVLNITHFIAGMTDTYAVDLYRIIKGISLPNY